MTEAEFYNKYNGVNGRPYAGAKYPKFEPTCINESEFADALRMKEVAVDFSEGRNGRDKIVVNWKSYSWSGDFDRFVKEVSRCFKHIGFVGDVELTLHNRDGDCKIYREFEINS